jgi:hypothetical protein
MIQNLIEEINKESFYPWLIRKLLENEQEYDSSCPCFHFFLPELKLRLDCSCWRMDNEFEYSGLTIFGDYPEVELDYLANFILDNITERWSNTDWQYSVNGKVKNYEIKPKYEQTR